MAFFSQKIMIIAHWNNDFWVLFDTILSKGIKNLQKQKIVILKFFNEILGLFSEKAQDFGMIAADFSNFESMGKEYKWFWT